MKLLPVAIAIFFENLEEELKLWVQVREDTGPFQGLLEFPGGGVEPDETPLEAVVREVEEEVGIKINPEDGKFMGIYSNPLQEKTILLYVFLFPKTPLLESKGQWLSFRENERSQIYKGQIPGPNHQIIDDLFLVRSNYDK
jgi:8-oxo-dGTP diphosphatase